MIWQEAVKEFMQDMHDDSHWTSQHRRELRLYGVEVGIYEGLTKHQLRNVQIMSTVKRKKYDFQYKGLYYSFRSWKPLNIPEVSNG